MAALETELREAHRRIEERLGIVQRELAESIAATKREADTSLAAARADMQTALSSLAEELAAVRKFMLQTAQLGWLNHELIVENAKRYPEGGDGQPGAVRELGKAGRDHAPALGELAGQLKELASRLDTIQGKVSSLK